MTHRAMRLLKTIELNVWLGACVGSIGLFINVALAASPTLRPDAALIAQSGNARGAPACAACQARAAKAGVDFRIWLV